MGHFNVVRVRIIDINNYIIYFINFTNIFIMMFEYMQFLMQPKNHRKDEFTFNMSENQCDLK